MNEDETSAAVQNREDLTDYLYTCASIMGGKSNDDGVDEKDQQGYSLLWYFKHCLEKDIDPTWPSFMPVLDTYLGAQYDDILHPKPAELTRAEERLLEQLVSESPDVRPLNQAQTDAVARGLHWKLSFIWGPPGTGKTEVITRLVTLAALDQRTVAIVSPNKEAVKNVVEKFRSALETNKDGTMARVAKQLAHLGSVNDRRNAKTLDGKEMTFDTENGKRGLVEDNNGIKHMFPDNKEAEGTGEGGWEKYVTFAQLTEQFPVIACTIHSLMKCSRDGDREKFDYVIMDEASQASIPLGIVAMAAGRHVVLVGDTEQLPPVVTDQVVKTLEEKGLAPVPKAYQLWGDLDGQSILESWKAVLGEATFNNLTTMLVEHYRCHPAIIGFCDEYIYGERLRYDGKTTGLEQDKAKIGKFNYENRVPIRIVWYRGNYTESARKKKIDKKEKKSSKQSSGKTPPDKNEKVLTSKVNRRQIEILECEEGKRIREHYREGRSIMFLSPFKAQVDEIDEALKRILHTASDTEKYSLTGEDHNDVYALTIHKAQGQQFDVVYLLPVEDGDWEWPWSQGKRLVNVAVSRAARELVVITSTMLMSDELQRKLTGVVTPAKLPSDPHKKEVLQHLFVQKLCSYTDELVERCDEVPAEYGFVQSKLVSVFDSQPFEARWIADLGDSHYLKDGEKDFATEQCLAWYLQGLGKEGLAFAQGVCFSQLLLDGKPLSELANEYKSPDEAHFDFVLYNKETRVVVVAIEVDGPFHRLKYSIHNGAKILEHDVEHMDQQKNALVEDACGGKVISLKSDKSSDSLGLAGLPDNISFALIRIPTDGTTYLETRALRSFAVGQGSSPESKAAEELPPTIEDYIERIQFVHELCKPSHTLTVGYRSEKNKESDCDERKVVGITNLLKNWLDDDDLAPYVQGYIPKTLNKRLEREGVLESCEFNGHPKHRPTQLGGRLGVRLKFSEEDGGFWPIYDVYAQVNVRDVLQIRGSR